MDWCDFPLFHLSCDAADVQPRLNASITDTAPVLATTADGRREVLGPLEDRGRLQETLPSEHPCAEFRKLYEEEV